jgi:hypothetical protein
MADADGAGAHCEATGLDAGLAESNGVGRRELAGEGGERQRMPREQVCGEERGSGGTSSAMKEFAAFHEASSRKRIESDCLSYRRTRKVFGYQRRKGEGEAAKLVAERIDEARFSLLDNLPINRFYMSNV